ncbi:MAG: glycosyltransferase family 2 protein [Chlorobi bacterium]|nr:glycosyltransferase family 2 protein [Chlorobiota bacterium]
MKYDLAIAYRVYPGISKSPAFHSGDKRRLVELGLQSLRAALGDNVRVRFYALLDGCPDDYEQLILRYFPGEHTILFRLDRVGNAATFLLQLQLLMEQSESEFVYFAEDDYLYRPGTFGKLLDFAASSEDIHFAAPYDYPDYYKLVLHRKCPEIRSHGGYHWRTAGSTCLTFLTRRSILQQVAKVFRTYQRGNFDASMWLALTKYTVRSPSKALRSAVSSRLEAAIIVKAWLYGWQQLLFGRRYQLWVPLPSMATHLERTALAPGVDWEAVAAAVGSIYH